MLRVESLLGRDHVGFEDVLVLHGGAQGVWRRLGDTVLLRPLLEL